MKRFKQLINEFRGSLEPPRDQGGNGGREDPKERVRRIMSSLPFTHVTTGEDTIHFHNSLEAAKMVADRLADHDLAMKYAGNRGDRMMTEYFGMSTGTHDDVLRAIQEHVESHRKLPNELIPHVNDVMDEIREESRRLAKMNNIGEPGKSVYHYQRVHTDSSRHPHFDNDTHHLKILIDQVSENPDIGYFLKKEEYK